MENIKNKYIPFGKEWKKEMRRFKKEALIDILAAAQQRLARKDLVAEEHAKIITRYEIKVASLKEKLGRVNTESLSNLIMTWASTRYTTFHDGDKYGLANLIMKMVHGDKCKK